MGDWTDKNNRIDILYNGSRRFLCVEHPALIQNHDKALQTLGGVETLQQIFSDSQKRLPLLWRPDNIYCKPAYGDRFSVSNLLMKVTKRRRKSDGREDYKVEFCGHIDTSYRFQAMADFQYLPMQLKPDGQYEDIYNKVVIDHLVPRSKYFDSDVPLYIPPLTFSRVDKTIDFNFKLPIKHGPSYKNPDDDRPAHYIGTVRQRRTIYTVFVNYGETLPTKPQPEAVERMNSNFVNKECKEKLEKLFEIKPVYLKVELEHKTGMPIMKLKSYLPAMAFYWLDGPWRAQWNKFGFDPTKNPSAKIYQTIDFRIRQLRPGQWWIKAKRGAGRLVQYNQTAHNQKHNVKISLQSLGDQKHDVEEGLEDKLLEQEALYKFRPDIVPPQRMMYYPAQYVEIPEVQKLIHKNDGKEKVCTEKDGWCVVGFSNLCRDFMYQYVNKLISIDDSVEYKNFRTKKKKRQLGMVDTDKDDSDNDDMRDSNDTQDSSSHGNLAGGEGEDSNLSDRLQGDSNLGDIPECEEEDSNIADMDDEIKEMAEKGSVSEDNDESQSVAMDTS